MGKTKHFEKRISQRGIQQDLVDKVFAYGSYVNGQIVLSKKQAEDALKIIDQFRKNFIKLCDKGGVAIAADGNELITAMNMNGRKRSIYS